MTDWLFTGPHCQPMATAVTMFVVCAALGSASATPPIVANSTGNSDTPGAVASPAAARQGNDDPYANRTAVQNVLRAVLSSRGVPKHQSEIDPDLPVVDSLQVISTSRKDAVLAWPKPAIIPPGWIVEVAKFFADPKTRTFFKVWIRHPDCETTKVGGDRLAMRVKSLQPGSVYEMRVLAINDEGKVSEPAAFAIVETKLPWRVPLAVWTTLIGVALAVVGYRLYRRR